MMSLAIVSREEARRLGLRLRARQAEADRTRFDLDFAPHGPLKDFLRVDLLIGGAAATALPHTAPAGRVTAGFATALDELDGCVLRVVTQSAPRRQVGFELRPKDFVELATGE